MTTPAPSAPAPTMPSSISEGGGAPTRRRFRRRRTVSAALAAGTALALLAAACSSSSGTSSPTEGGTQPIADDASVNKLEAADPPVEGGNLTIGITAETPGWNPHKNQWADAGNLVGSTVIETLGRFDASGGVQPWLLESFAPKKEGDYEHWVLKVKPGIKFHDGTDLTAAVVKANIDEARTTSLSAVATGYMFDSLEAPDPLTVEVNLTEPWASFPSYLGNAYIMAEAMMKAENGMTDQPVGTGPFEFVDWVPDKSFKVRKNKNYWQKGLPHLDTIEFRTIIDNKSRVQSLESGDLDMIVTTRAGDISQLQDKGFTVVSDFNSEKTFVMLNTQENPDRGPDTPPNPFTNIHARRALMYATDPAKIRELVGEGLQIGTSTQIQVEGSDWGMDPAQTGYGGFDQAKARSEIEEYKKATGRDSLTFELTGVANTDDQQVQQQLAQQWEEVGITVSINSMEQGAYVLQQVSGKYQAGYFRNYAYPDPDADYYFFHSRSAKGFGQINVNFHMVKDDAIDKALDDGRGSTDRSVRKAHYEAATKAINEQVLDIWLFNTPQALISAKGVRGLNPAREQPFGNFLSKTWLWVSLWKQPT